MGASPNTLDLLGSHGQAAQGAVIQPQEAVDGRLGRFEKFADIVLLGQLRQECKTAERDILLRVLERVVDRVQPASSGGFELITEVARAASTAVIKGWFFSFLPALYRASRSSSTCLA